MISRFNPTTNGPLHIGHVYSALVNRAESDKMILRFDDNQRYWIEKYGRAAMRQFAASQLRDLLWLGIEPDEVSYNSKMEAEANLEIARCPHFRVVQDYSPVNAELTPTIRAKIEPWAPSSWLVAEKVVFDHMQDITVMARGLELLQENSLYMYLCGIFGYAPPMMIYIPRLMDHDGREMTDISKTRGEWKVKDLRESGASPEDVIFALRKACLVNPDGTWHAKNVKLQPSMEGITI